MTQPLNHQADSPSGTWCRPDGDTFRLAYHFMPLNGWMNDPNGFTYYDGKYHLFYQHTPDIPEWGPMHWGHAVSEDLIRWQHLPVALYPSEPYDSSDMDVPQGCFSGSSWPLPEGGLALLYTGHVDVNSPMQTQNLAFSKDGVVFSKSASNPIISSAPDGGSEDFRDPKVFEDSGRTFMVLGNSKDNRGRILLYETTDPYLIQWMYRGVAWESDGLQGSMWECPDLFALAEKHCLLYSPMQGAINCEPRAAIGNFNAESGRFLPHEIQQLDYGVDFYAPQTISDSAGRRIMIGWMQQWFQQNTTAAEGWSGAMTIPRELLLENDMLIQRPVVELVSLRGDFTALDEVNRRYELDTSCEIHLRLKIVSGAGARVHVRSSLQGEEGTVFTVDVKEQRIVCDRSLSGIGEASSSVAPIISLEDEESREVELHWFVDTCSTELFINGGTSVMTNRIFPKRNSKYFVIEPIANSQIEILSGKCWTLEEVSE